MEQDTLLQAVIFDMDGVLIDTMPLHHEVDRMLFRFFHIDPDGIDLSKNAGLRDSDIWAANIADFHLNTTLDEVMKKSMDIKHKLITEGNWAPIDGVPELLLALEAEHIPTAVASSSHLPFIEAVLDKIKIRRYFQAVLSGEDLVKSKPDPEVFLKAAALVHTEPSGAVVIEDAHHGVAAAKKAGMRCVGYDDPKYNNQDLSLADLVVPSMRDITPAILRGLFKATPCRR